jgi:uncharacterized HhH-GPD family protein
MARSLPIVTPAELPVTSDPEANELLVNEPFALLIGMLLDQQVPMEWAFKGPYTLKQRLGGELDPSKLAAMAPEQVEELFKQKPALHRFPGSMGKRTHAVASYVAEHYDGDTARIWTEAEDGADLYDRLRELPGYGDEKAKIFMAILAKRLDIKPEGWVEAAAPFSDDTPRSVADIDTEEAFQRVRAFKKEMKAKGKDKGD